MSRIGKKPIALQKATVEIKGDHIVVKGPNGQLERDIPQLISVVVEDDQIQVKRENDSKQARSLHGLVRSLVQHGRRRKQRLHQNPRTRGCWLPCKRCGQYANP